MSEVLVICQECGNQRVAGRKGFNPGKHFYATCWTCMRDDIDE